MASRKKRKAPLASPVSNGPPPDDATDDKAVRVLAIGISHTDTREQVITYCQENGLPIPEHLRDDKAT